MAADFQPTEQLLRDGEAAHVTPPGWLPHTVRQLERWVGWSIALYTAWLAVLSHVPTLWFFVLYAGLVGKWAEAHPARTQGAMTLRALTLLAGGFILHLNTATPFSFFFWPAITCVGYALMLQPGWAAGIVAAAACEIAAAFLQAGPERAIQPLLAQAGFLAIFPLLIGTRFGESLRRPGDALEIGRIDPATQLYNKAGLSVYGSELLAECRSARKAVSIAVFDCADLPEVRAIYGSSIADRLTERVVERMTVLAGERGLAARTGPTEFTVVLPGLARERAVAAVERVLGKPSRIEFDAGDSEIVLVPAVAIDSAGPDSGSVDDVHRNLRARIAAFEQDEARRLRRQQRSRESHSRPMSITPLAERHPVARRAAPVHVSPTLPAPLVLG